MVPLLTVVIVNWNTAQLLKECLGSLYKNTAGLALEAFVVDNNSSDDSVSMVKRCFPRAKVLENSENAGFAKANNQAIAASSGTYVLLLNSDTVVLPGAIEAMIGFLDRNPAAGICGANLIDRHGKHTLSYWQDVPTPFSQLKRDFPFPGILRQAGHSETIVPAAAREPFEVERVSGASLMIRRKTIEDIGLLDEAFFFYAEDLDWCRRARGKGWQIFCIPAARIVHYGGQSSGRNSARYEAQFYRSRYMFFKKYYGGFSLFAWRSATVCFMVWALFRDWCAYVYRLNDAEKMDEHRSTIRKDAAIVKVLLSGRLLREG